MNGARNGVAATLLAICLAKAGLVSAQIQMDMVQTLSDQAQGMTISFDGLAFLTGSLGADSFLPPGKVADFSGFQYLRDNDPTGLGHNTEFVTLIAHNILSILSSSQISQLVARAQSQLSLIDAYGYGRFPLMDAFRRNLTNNIPSGSTGLDWAMVTQRSADLYYIDGLISLDRAQLFGDILRGLTASQAAALANLKTLGGVGNWPTIASDPLRDLRLSPAISVGVMTYASEMYSWYAGSVEADTYFCPERQGTYFGSFYLKDTPAMNSTNYTIDANLTADVGNAFLAALTPAQRLMVTNLVTVQKPYLYDLVAARSNISVQLRQLIVTNSIDTNAVLALCRHYGELDGMIVYCYATHFAKVYQSLSTNQLAALMAMRVNLLGTNLLYPSGAYLYSAPVAMPAVANTDSMFGSAATNRISVSDSGQTNSYTTVFGEDADYAINLPSFSNAAGMVYDRVTGRVWQQSDGGEMTWEAAAAYASSLRLGGYSDWRLPTAHELFGIVNHGRANPALDPTYFAASTGEYWWTRDSQADSASNVWVVNAGGGVGPHPKSETIGAGGSKRFHVRCVRGAAAPLQAGLNRHFISNADGTVTDLDTGLTWQQAEATARTWVAALQYAESLALADHTDWRLPNVKELQSLNDETLVMPSVDTNFFPGAQAAEYWSSTTLLNDTNRAWFLDFHRGIASYADKTELRPLRCVRGGEVRAVTAAGAAPVRLVSGLGFTEGPAADGAGNLYFSDIPANIIYRWSLAGQLSVFRTDSGGANGLAFDGSGRLIACEGNNGRITATTLATTNVTVLAATFNGVRFNEPNDLWISPAGGVYFTDPVYLGHALVQGGEHAYFLPPAGTSVVRVASDLVKPNGVVGTSDGSVLYMADWGASNVYRYGIQSDGTLTGRTPFAAVRCDGMTLDTAGNLYLCEDTVRVLDAAGHQVEQIVIPERPTNVEFGGAQRQFLFITTDGGSLYAVRMATRGVGAVAVSNQSPVIVQAVGSLVAPTTSDVVWVSARITDDSAVASAVLTYGAVSLGGSTTTVFRETMRTAELKPWSGDGCDQPWTVTAVGGNPFEQRIGSNNGEGNPCGLEFKLGTTNLPDSMITTAQSIDARGASGSVEFWLWTGGLSGTMGWTLQLDAGSGFVTRLSELNGTSHGWQLYHYDLQSGERVSNLRLRFQFRGGSGDPRIDLDRITVQTTPLSGIGGTVVLLDDGLHQDGAAGDHVYGAAIPALSIATTLCWYVTALDDVGAETRMPSNAPASVYTYTTFLPTADSIGDGIPDWWRARQFGGSGTTTNSASAASADPDGDQADNRREYLAGTSPTDPGSVLCFASVAVETASVKLTWPSVAGRTYKLQFSTNILADAFSTTVASGIGANPPLNSHAAPIPVSGGTFFYRIAVE